MPANIVCNIFLKIKISKPRCKMLFYLLKNIFLLEGSATEESSCNQSRHRIRPLDGSNILSAGIVEVQNEIGQWGVICDDGWDDDDAFVLCSCLGYQEYVQFRICN